MLFKRVPVAYIGGASSLSWDFIGFLCKSRNFSLFSPLFSPLHYSFLISPRRRRLLFEFPGSTGARPRQCKLSSSSVAKNISSVQSLSHVRLFVIPRTAAHQASLSLPTPRFYSNSCPLSQWCHPNLSLCHPLLLLPPVFIKVFSNESVLRIRWPKYWSFSFNISLPMNIRGWFPLGWTGWMSLLWEGLSKVFSNTTVHEHEFFNTQFSL